MNMTTGESLERLLASFGSKAVVTGREFLASHHEKVDRQPLSTRIASFDRLSGGLKRGTLIEIVGRGSSGRFSLGLAALAAATQAGEATALVDLGDNLDPHVAQRIGIDLKRLFWVRPQKLSLALQSAEILLN